jgi:cyclic pyranopterin monophosphate synthase
MTGLTHIARDGSARMVDVSGKSVTERVAVAEGRVRMRPQTLAVIRAGDAKKGDVLGVARIAGIMAAKRTHELIPLCHPLAIAGVTLDLTLDDASACVRVTASVKTSGKTGVEMEALTAVSIACLTIYDMVKAVDRGMTIEAVRLVEKRGGASGEWRAEPPSTMAKGRRRRVP